MKAFSIVFHPFPISDEFSWFFSVFGISALSTLQWEYPHYPTSFRQTQLELFPLPSERIPTILLPSDKPKEIGSWSSKEAFLKSECLALAMFITVGLRN